MNQIQHLNQFCPRCLPLASYYKNDGLAIMANDGGSTSCKRCRVLFHWCSENLVRYGSPGPLMCLDCKGRKK